jgi:hypothetical protein
VFCKRDIDAIRNSKKRCLLMSKQKDKTLHENALLLYERIYSFVMANGGHEVEYEKIMNDDYSQFYPIAAKEGFVFEPQIVDNLKDPQHRHF